MTSQMGHGNLIYNKSLWDQTKICMGPLKTSILYDCDWTAPDKSEIVDPLLIGMQNDEQVDGWERERERERDAAETDSICMKA